MAQKISNRISMSEAKNILLYAIENNNKLSDNGKMPIAVGLEASAGIGKTSLVRQIAEEKNMGFVKIDLHQLEESGDLLGYPTVEYECLKSTLVKKEDGSSEVKTDSTPVWVNSKQLETAPKNVKYRSTGNTRMTYAKPAWVPEYNENGTIVCLDDYTRANPQLLQSSMDLILEQKYVSWELPKRTTIILTCNADDGEYNVNSLDEAQSSRFMNFEVLFDPDMWAQWAEANSIDGRCINFVLSNSDELFGADDEGNRICNPRSFTMFSQMISGIDNWDDAGNMEFISTIAKGCFNDDGRFAKMFKLFIVNKMHMLIQPDRMLHDSFSEVKDKMLAAVYDKNGSYRPDIAMILERRFVNYVNTWLNSDEKSSISTVINRLVEFIKQSEEKDLFKKDLIYHMVRTIYANNRRKAFVFATNLVLTDYLKV